MISVITPAYPPSEPYLRETYESLRAQTLTDWEWVVLPNNGLGSSIARHFTGDSRVRVLEYSPFTTIGGLKRQCCEQAHGEIIVELDADDLLVPHALASVHEACQHADFVYSDFAEFRDGTWAPNTYRADYGWTTYPVSWQGHAVLAHHAPPATAHTLRYVLYAPNHVRAWTKAAYLAVGGHDPKLLVGDDHDLICRFYLAQKRFAHIPDCLYFYRVHPLNAVQTHNAQIQIQSELNYNRFIWAMAEQWARDQGLRIIDLCGGHDCPAGYEPWDLTLGHDLEQKWPAQDDSVGLIRATDALEHLRDPVHTMNEAYRVLAPGGFFFGLTPSTDGKGAWADPTHTSFWNSLSFRYYTSAQFARYVPEFRGRFQDLRTLDITRNGLPYVESMLAALKPGYRPMGQILWPDRTGFDGTQTERPRPPVLIRHSSPPARPLALVTANFGGLDAVYPVPDHHKIQSLYFADTALTPEGHVVTYPRMDWSPRLRAKYFKLQMHRLEAARLSLWLAWADASVEFTSLEWLAEAMDRLAHEPQERQALFLRHPDRQTVQDEYAFITDQMARGNLYLRTRYEHEPMAEQLEYWRQQGGDPATAPLWCGGVFMVRNTRFFHAFLNDWWDQQLRFSIMDQLPVPFLFDRYGITPWDPGLNIYQNRYWTWRR